MTSSDKAWSWVKKGVPVRIEVGPREISEGMISFSRRDGGPKGMKKMTRSEFLTKVIPLLNDIQHTLYERALQMQKAHTHKIDSKEEFYAFFTPKNAEKPETHGGFAYSHWSGDAAEEEQVKKDLNVTIRCIPLDSPQEEGRCVISGKKSLRRVIFAKSY
jgi:prolyl-tRNA synthetase